MGQNASNDFVSVAAEIEILIPKVIVAFHDAARRSADLQRAAHNFHEPVEGSNERQFSPNTRGEVDTTAAQSTLDHQKDPDLFLGTQLPHDNHVGRESEFEPIRAPTIEAGAAITNAVGRRLIDLETMEVLEDRRKVEDFATVEIPESTEDSTPSPST